MCACVPRARPSKTAPRQTHKIKFHNCLLNRLMFVSKYALRINASKSGGGKYPRATDTYGQHTPRGFYGANRQTDHNRSSIKRLLIGSFDEICLRYTPIWVGRLNRGTFCSRSSIEGNTFSTVVKNVHQNGRIYFLRMTLKMTHHTNFHSRKFFRKLSFMRWRSSHIRT